MITEDRQEVETHILDGRYLSHPPSGEEICITGMSGRFPASENIEEFKRNLYDKVDMVSENIQRWDYENADVPKRGGRLTDIDKFDAGFFGIHGRQADNMDPMARIFLENTVEAILDAGLHPSDMEGTKTGVFVGTIFSESERHMFYEVTEPQSFGMTGALRSMITNRVSYFLKLNGPSYIADTACSSSLYALDNAYCAMRNGICDMAIVGGTHLTLNPLMTMQFRRLGVLGMDGCCKSFDDSGNGYVRSEAICCILLQKSKDAKRIYARLVHTKTNCDGYKDSSVTYPSGHDQAILLKDFYDECQIDPRSLSFLEAHATGTLVGDPEELGAIDKVFCVNREDPLLIGAVKSNIGHTEASSALCSIIKGIIAFEDGYIPPNIHYKSPRKGVEVLESGRVQVVVDKIPFKDDRGLVGVSCFGFGGSNSHCLLHWNTKVKVNGGEPEDDIPRLVLMSSRVPEGITSFVKSLESRPLDGEYIGLLHEIFRKDIAGHNHRGYSIVSKDGKTVSSSSTYSYDKTRLVLAVGSLTGSWHKLVEELSIIPTFNETINRVRDILSEKNLEMLNFNNPSLHPVVNDILGNLATQLGLIDILKELEIRPDSLVGNGIGRLVCAYFDGTLSLEQVVECSLEFGNHMKTIKGAEMLSGQEKGNKISHKLPIISEYGSGYPKKGTQLKRKDGVESLGEEEDCKTKVSNGNNYIHITNGSETPASVETQLSNSKLTKPTNSHDRKDLILGIGSWDKSLSQKHRGYASQILELNGTSHKNSVQVLLEVIGSLYQFGYNPQVQKLYPKIQFPVGRGTPSISSKIKWDHSTNWYVFNFSDDLYTVPEETTIPVSLKEEQWQYVSGHVIDGRNLFPAIGYLHLVWSSFAEMNLKRCDNMNVVFEDCKFRRSTNIDENTTNFNLATSKKYGNFEIMEGEAVVVSGRIIAGTEQNMKQIGLPIANSPSGPDVLPLKSKDVYKELRLRGYNYMGAFRAIQEADVDGVNAYIKWDGNWVAFLDNMLQLKILGMDTRSLFVPTSIRKLIINAEEHMEYVKSFGDDPVLPVHVFKESGIMRCGGIQIEGLMASSITRRKPLGQPVLEKYVFVPNEGELPLQESLRVNIQIGLENLYTTKVKVLELIDAETEVDAEPAAPIIIAALGDQPLIEADVTILSQNEVNVQGVRVDKKSIDEQEDCFLVVGSKILQRQSILETILKTLKPGGFIISREGLGCNLNKVDGYDILTVHKTVSETLVLFRPSLKSEKYSTIKISGKTDEFTWLPTLQSAIRNDEHVIIFTQNEEINGVMGLFNCSRREPGGRNVKCVVINDEAAPFDPNHTFYREQLDKNMVFNAYENGKWGTYRHLLIPENVEVESEHLLSYLSTRGDLSSFKWIEGTLRSSQNLVKVYYSSLNFKDVMTASGRISIDSLTTDRMVMDHLEGFEYVGRDLSGRRVMGMVENKGLSTLVEGDSNIMWSIPENWTMEEAATVTVIYTTVLYALITRGSMKRGESILIHSGTGGVGQAAINVALAHGLNIFTTVGTAEKKQFILENFPQVKESQIGCSRDVSFEQMVKRKTKGVGVDMVLNSLAEEKLLASVGCLKHGGRFIEIGKFDLSNNNELCLALLRKECSFHGVMVDLVMAATPKVKSVIKKLLDEGVKMGAVKPINRNIFKMDEVERAFRFMTSGSHKGKVILQIRQEEQEKTVQTPQKIFKGFAKYSCDPEKSFIIAGGLGGFGLELADWLILRGARKIILTSRNGIRNGYQSYRIKIWRSYGAIVKISTANIAEEKGCEKLITEAEQLGPVHSIFNLAVDLQDALIENQTVDSFQKSLNPKAVATKILDEVTRRRCPELRDFVVFSSVVCGRGNVGQTNYGMANSIMEKICEKRRRDGLPGLAIEWGAVGDVGLVAEMQEENTEIVIGGTLQQRISSCLRVMDTFLKQKEAAVVSSIVVAEKKSGFGDADNIVDAVANILGIKKDTVSPNATLPEIGMDSMTAVEIKQILEREFEVFLTAQEIRNVTLARLQEIQDSKSGKESGQTLDVKVDKSQNFGHFVLVTNFGEETDPNIQMVRLTSLANDDDDVPYAFLFPGIESISLPLQPLAKKMKAKVFCMQFSCSNPHRTYKDLVQESVSQIENILKSPARINIVCYSWGTIVGLATMAELERKGYKGRVVCLDGSPEFVSNVCKQQLKSETDAEIDSKLLCHIMALFFPLKTVKEFETILMSCADLQERISKIIDFGKGILPMSTGYQRDFITAIHCRLREAMKYKPEFGKINSPVKLFRPTQKLVDLSISDDYNLNEICQHFEGVEYIEGTHATMLGSAKLTQSLNMMFNLS